LKAYAIAVAAQSKWSSGELREAHKRNESEDSQHHVRPFPARFKPSVHHGESDPWPDTAECATEGPGRARLRRKFARFSTHTAAQIADIYAYRQESDSAFVWLDRAYVQHDPGIADVQNDPWLQSLRGDTRYLRFLQKMHLAR